MEFDEINYWSEIKLEIVRKYAKAYSTILSKQRQPALSHVYIDGFAGRGMHLSKRRGELVLGSPLNALNVEPPFREHFLIDLDGDKVDQLRDFVGNRSDVHVFTGDCNRILLDEVFPLVRWEDYRRGLCLLDPYGLHLDWEVMAKAGEMRTIDLFLNFPTMDMNRNALWRNPDGASAEGQARMTTFWGSETWRDQAYKSSRQLGLFGGADTEKATNDEVVKAFTDRLKHVAGFKYVPEAMPMKNSKGAVVYYLVFASQKPVAGDIVQEIFDTYRLRSA